MNRFSSNLRVFLVAGIALFVSACASTVHISEDLSPSELIQRAQEASDKNRYNVALQYYEALYERNRTDINLVITAEYEIAFIHYKQKKYQQARAELNMLLEYYEAPDQQFLPQQFKRLAEIVIDRITEKEQPRLFSSKKTG